MFALVDNKLTTEFVHQDDPRLAYDTMQPWGSNREPLKTADVKRYDTEVTRHHCMVDGSFVSPHPCPLCEVIDIVLSAVNSVLIANGITLRDSDLLAMGLHAKQYKRDDDRAELKESVKGLLHDIGIDVSDPKVRTAVVQL